MHQKVYKITTFFLRAQKINPKNYKNSHFANSTLQNRPNLHISKICSNFGTPLPSVYSVNLGRVPSEATVASCGTYASSPLIFAIRGSAAYDY
jgi:hypothetical protein